MKCMRVWWMAGREHEVSREAASKFNWPKSIYALLPGQEAVWGKATTGEARGVHLPTYSTANCQSFINPLPSSPSGITAPAAATT